MGDRWFFGLGIVLIFWGVAQAQSIERHATAEIVFQDGLEAFEDDFQVPDPKDELFFTFNELRRLSDVLGKNGIVSIRSEDFQARPKSFEAFVAQLQMLEKALCHHTRDGWCEIGAKFKTVIITPSRWNSGVEASEDGMQVTIKPDREWSDIVPVHWQEIWSRFNFLGVTTRRGFYSGHAFINEPSNVSSMLRMPLEIKFGFSKTRPVWTLRGWFQVPLKIDGKVRYVTYKFVESHTDEPIEPDRATNQELGMQAEGPAYPILGCDLDAGDAPNLWVKARYREQYAQELSNLPPGHRQQNRTLSADIFEEEGGEIVATIWKRWDPIIYFDPQKVPRGKRT